MSKDPAFLFYPADASEDTQFMNRLERGCYFDILKAQKKFGKFSLPQIKKVLGNDFESCWPAIELVLKIEDGFYFIEWANDSLEKRKLFSESRAKNRKKRTSDEDMNNICTSYEQDMLRHEEDMVNGIVNENVNKDFGKSENLLIPALYKIFVEKNAGYLKNDKADYSALQTILKYLCELLGEDKNRIYNNTAAHHALKLRWGEIVAFVVNDNFYQSFDLPGIQRNFRAIILKQKNGTTTAFKKPSKSAGRDKLAEEIAADINFYR
jgi:hypothetical protein